MNKSIKLLSLNTSLFDQNNDKLVRFFKETVYDIVCLQEVTRKVDDSAKDSLISKNAIDMALPDLNHSFYAPNWVLKDFKQNNFHGKKVFECHFGGQIECGTYLKSNFRIIGGESIFVQKHFSYIIDWEHEAEHPGEEPRMVQVVDLAIDTVKKLRILNYHGIWSRNKLGTDRTFAACQKIKELALQVDYPSIICGDFNLFPHTQSMQIFNDGFTSLVDKYNITSTRPQSNELSKEKRNVVDYIFVSKGISVNNFNALQSDVSDHLPLVLEFGIL